MHPAAQALAKPQRHLQLYAVKGHRFLQRRPLLAKSLPTGVGFAFGDFLTQSLNRTDKSKAWYNYQRTATMGVIGLVVAGPIGLGFLRWMDGWVLPAVPMSPASLGIKFTLDQVLGCAMWQLAFLSIHPPYRHQVTVSGHQRGRSVLFRA